MAEARRLAPRSTVQKGYWAQLTKAVLERALDVEIADHLIVLSTAGPVELEVRLDRRAKFDPVIVPKR